MQFVAPNPSLARERVLHAYLLGKLPFEQVLTFQRRMVYEISGDRSMGALILCEHPPCISIGRTGSVSHIQIESEELATLRWPIHWVNRGGGCLLHVPGQLACYPLIALDAIGLNVQQYLDRMHSLIRDVLQECDVPAELLGERPGAWVGGRQIAHVGVAVRDWVAYFGCAINVNPSLKPFRRIACDGMARPMTSMERERRGRIRSSTIRQRVVEQFAVRFGFNRTAIFHNHSSLPKEVRVHAVAASSR